MTVIERPWARVKQPKVIPREVSHDLVVSLPVEQLAALLRDHLLPSGPSGPEREAWDRFWSVLRENDDLAERAFDVLEEFLDDTEDALEATDEEDPQRKRMQKFLLNAQNAWQRLQKESPRTSPSSATVARKLVAAIADHETTAAAAGAQAQPHDLRLWNILHEARRDFRGANHRPR